MGGARSYVFRQKDCLLPLILKLKDHLLRPFISGYV